METPPESPRDRPIRILIVDDDRAIADILREYLASTAGRQVEACYDGLTASQRIADEAFDLVITDVVMPGLGGLDVLRCAKAANPDGAVIIITGYATLENAIAAVKEGADDYIRKPFKLEEMNIAVNKAIEKICVKKENRRLRQKLEETEAELTALKKAGEAWSHFNDMDRPPANLPIWQQLNGPAGVDDDVIVKLRALFELKQSGVLTDAEFNALKRHFLKLSPQNG